MTGVSFSIPIIDDYALEGNESFILNINLSSVPSNVTLGDPDLTTVTIVDNDRKLHCIFKPGACRPVADVRLIS